MKLKIELILKKSKFAFKVYSTVLNTLLRFIGLFIKTNPNLILMNEYQGTKYNDSVRILFEAMVDDVRFNNREFIWAFARPSDFTIPRAKKIKIDTPEYFITALKAGVWITNVNIERGLKFKKRGTFYLNTWHSLTHFKAIGNAQGSRTDYDFSDVDLFLQSVVEDTETKVKNFKVRSEALKLYGLPRNDRLFENADSEKEKLKKKFGIPENKKVILYAPTFRESTDGGKSRVLAPPIDLKKWEEQLSDDFVLIIRIHRLVTKIENLCFNDFVLNFTDYPDINDLFIVADIMISDYSSVWFEYSILERPMICFPFDYDGYMSKTGMTFDLKNDFTGLICNTDAQLLEAITSLKEDGNYQAESEHTIKFKKRFIQTHGGATAACLDEINTHIKMVGSSSTPQERFRNMNKEREK